MPHRFIRRAGPASAGVLCILAVLAFAALQGAAGHAHVPEAFRFIPSVPEIQSLLQSSDLRHQAWGAWLAAQSRSPVLVSAVQRVPEQHRDAKTWPTPAVLDAALDRPPCFRYVGAGCLLRAS